MIVRTFLLVASFAFVLALSSACTRSPEGGAARQSTASARPGDAGSPMAIARTLNVDVDEAKLATVFDEVRSACGRLAAERCELLASRLAGGRVPGASLRFRATAKGIDALVSDIRSRGTIVDEATTAEDLGGPIADVARNREMLVDYRAKLEALVARSSNDVDALIKLNRELARTQNELETATGSAAALSKRVETQTLDVTLATRRNDAFWRPIGDALADFGQNLSLGISGTVTAAAYLIPWAILVAVVGAIGRALWRRRRVRAPKR